MQWKSEVAKDFIAVEGELAIVKSDIVFAHRVGQELTLVFNSGARVSIRCNSDSQAKDVVNMILNGEKDV